MPSAGSTSQEVLVELRLELARSPARVAGEDAGATRRLAEDAQVAVCAREPEVADDEAG